MKIPIEHQPPVTFPVTVQAPACYVWVRPAAACSFRRALLVLLVLTGQINPAGVQANPTGGTVSQGNATFTSVGSQLTIQTSSSAYINWQSFNIGAGETTTFVQPSATSVVWNHITDANPSQILGTLNANGYVILQNQSGFYIGGQASLNAHGLILTTAAATPNLALSGGAWDFNAPPVAAKIVNYGQINIEGGGPVFLIANDIENSGSITAPGGNIGLYAGQHVLVSTSPDGRGLSAEVQLPQGSVDNSGHLTADAGNIVLQAKVVNQGGVIQANSAREVNGSIELYASDALNLEAGSSLSAQGDSTGVSSGGTIVIKSDNTFSDQVGSSINVAGGAQGGNGGQVEISAPQINSLQTTITGQAANGYVGGVLTLDPLNIILTSSGGNGTSGEYSSGSVGSSDSPTSGTLTLNVNSFSPTLSQINLQAVNDIELSTVWNLTDPGVPAKLTLTAGNDIILDSGAGINAGKNWSVSLSAGPTTLSAAPTAGTDGIYLLGNAYIQTQDGNINLWAANQLVINWNSDTPNNGKKINVTKVGGTVVDALKSGVVGSNGIRTLAGGNITVQTLAGDVLTGGNVNGYTFDQLNAPYYVVNAANLGGISTAAGGNVTISAGGNVISYLPSQSDWSTTTATDGGVGAFGSQPGNVTITAGGQVVGNYVLANGTGVITAGGDIGNTKLLSGFLLSLIKGNWTVNDLTGTIYLEDVINPNGIFNYKKSQNNTLPKTYAGYHYFDYDASASLTLNGYAVQITGANFPSLAPDLGAGQNIPVLLPPILDIVTGAGGLTLGATVDVFASANSEINITTTGGGNLIGGTLQMLSSGNQWIGTGLSGATILPNAGSAPVQIDVSGSIENFSLVTTKATQINVGGDIINSSFSGRNLNAGDTTSIHVKGNIYNSPGVVFIMLDAPIVSANPLDANAWDSVFMLAVNASVSSLNLSGKSGLALIEAVHNYLVFPTASQDDLGTNPGFTYDSTTGKLGYAGNMSAATLSYLTGTLTVLKVVYNASLGWVPVLDANGHLETTTYNFLSSADLAQLNTLYTESKVVPAVYPTGYQLQGPGTFDLSVGGNVELGNTAGIRTSSGAAIDLDVAGDISMLTSRITTTGGGDVNVTCGGSIDLGSQYIYAGSGRDALGIWTSGYGSDVTVIAAGDIDINGSRIAAYNSGNVLVKSLNGSINVGAGGNDYVQVTPFANPIYGSGIVAVGQPGYSPGNITVETPNGNITSSQAGILQLALGGNVTGTPTITLIAGTPGVPGSASQGNIDLGDAGLIGYTTYVTGSGNISGVFISRQNSTINAGQNFSGTLYSEGTASVAAGGAVSGSLIGNGSMSVSGSQISADISSGSVSVNGGVAASTLGTATASASSQSAAQQASSGTKEVGSHDAGEDEDPLKKKKHTVLKRMKRVTVILPPTS